MKWQLLLQARRPTCPPLVSDDHRLCFLAGLPLSIHVYSSQSALLVSSLRLPDAHSSKHNLISILRHPSSPHQLVILVSSVGTVYFFDFISNSIRATYETGLLITHAAIRPPPSLPPADPASRSNSPITIFLASRKVPQPATANPPVSPFKNPPRRSKNRPQSILYAVKLDPPPSSQGPEESAHYPPKSIEKRFLAKIEPISTFSSSPCGNWLGVVNKLNLWIIRIKPIDLFQPSDGKEPRLELVHLSTPEKITSIAFPPKAHADYQSSDPNQLSIVPCDFFATGSVSGKIALWHALSEAQWSRFTDLTARKPAIALPCPTSVSHWHSHAVADLTFTHNGSHLLSGGEEAVLVLWRLDDFGAIGVDSKTFLPRLGTQISSISLVKTFDELNQPSALVIGRDGIIIMVNVSSMSVSKTLKLPRMYQLPPVYKNSADPILLPISSESNLSEKRPYGNLLLQSSHPCGLHILDGGNGNVVDEILVRPKNIVSRKGARPIVEPKLLFAALGGVNDRYLGTIDSWVDEGRGFTPEITLKLWERDDQNSNRFQVIARVDNPHDDSQITSFKLTTESVPKLITTSIDGTIKIWTSSCSNNNLNLVVNAITSATTSLGKVKKSTKESFENFKSIQLRFKNYGILKSRISKDNSLLILLHRHPRENIISIWDLIHLKFLNSFILDSPSIKLKSLLDFNADKKSNLSKLKNFHVHDLDFLGDKNQFILVLGNFGCGLFDLLTGSEIGFWNCKPKFMIKTIDETKVVIVHEKRAVMEEKTHEKGKDEKNLEKETTSKKKHHKTSKKGSKVTMMAIIDVVEKKSIMNHKIRGVTSGRFIATRKNQDDLLSSSHSSEVLTKEDILDGLVLVTESAGLIRVGPEIEGSGYDSIVNRTLEIEKQVGISSGLPFQEIFNNNDQSLKVYRDNPNKGTFEYEQQNLINQDEELKAEMEKLVNLSSHLIPPSRFIWSQLIQPNRLKQKMKKNVISNGSILVTDHDKKDENDQEEEHVDDQPSRTAHLPPHSTPPTLLSLFNRTLLTHLQNPNLVPFQLDD